MKLSTKGRYGVRLMITWPSITGGPVLLRRSRNGRRSPRSTVEPCEPSRRGAGRGDPGGSRGYVLGKRPGEDHDERDRRGLGRVALPCGLCRKTGRLRPRCIVRRPRSLERAAQGIVGFWEIHPGRHGAPAEAKRENVGPIITRFNAARRTDNILLTGTPSDRRSPPEGVATAGKVNMLARSACLVVAGAD